eukprot:12940294-Alexandrium_andersonii.AAC.1
MVVSTCWVVWVVLAAWLWRSWRWVVRVRWLARAVASSFSMSWRSCSEDCVGVAGVRSVAIWV